MLLSCHVPIFEWIYTLQLPLCQGTPCPKQAQYLKGRGGRALILTYLDSDWSFSAPLIISFQFWPSSGRNGWSKLDQKCKLWVRLLFMKTRILQFFFKQRYCLLEYFLWWEFQQYWTIFGGVTQKGPFHGCWIDTKTLRTFSLTTKNAIMMKLTTIMYLHESENKKNFRARNSGFWSNVYKFIDSIENHHICHALPFVASLVKLYTNSMKKIPKIGPKWLLR